MVLSFYEQQKLWRTLDTLPSHDFKIDATYENVFNGETNKFSAKLPKGEIPNQLVVDDTLPTRDALITFVDDPKKIQYRVIMFGIRHHTTRPVRLKDETTWVGGVVCDYGIVRPMVRFGVNNKTNSLVIEDDIQWLECKSIKDIVEWEKIIDGPYKLSKRLIKRILKIWYGIELYMLYPAIVEANGRKTKNKRYSDYLSDSRIDIPEDVVTGYPDMRPYNKTPGAKGAEGYYVGKSSWFKQGYNWTCDMEDGTQKQMFIQPVINRRTPQSEAEEKGHKKLEKIRNKKRK